MHDTVSENALPEIQIKHENSLLLAFCQPAAHTQFYPKGWEIHFLKFTCSSVKMLMGSTEWIMGKKGLFSFQTLHDATAPPMHSLCLDQGITGPGGKDKAPSEPGFKDKWTCWERRCGRKRGSEQVTIRGGGVIQTPVAQEVFIAKALKRPEPQLQEMLLVPCSVSAAVVNLKQLASPSLITSPGTYLQRVQHNRGFFVCFLWALSHVTSYLAFSSLAVLLCVRMKQNKRCCFWGKWKTKRGYVVCDVVKVSLLPWASLCILFHSQTCIDKLTTQEAELGRKQLNICTSSKHITILSFIWSCVLAKGQNQIQYSLSSPVLFPPALLLNALPLLLAIFSRISLVFWWEIGSY